jgi:hypothetical protein
MIDKHERITTCEHYGVCTYVLYVGKCQKACLDKYRKTQSHNKTLWRSRAYYNDYLWVECSNCDFRVEATTAVITGKSSTDFVGVKYKYCPNCGKPMEV